MKIGFMGMGFVGGTTAKVLESVHEIIPYDIDPKKGYLENLLKLKDAEAIFLSVPTPMMPSGKKVEDIYKPIFPNANYIHLTTKEAEMVKYMANVMLTLQIAAANEFYQICKSMNIDYNTIKNAVLLDERIGRNLNVPGHDGDLGFGGKCFPKDLNALIYLARENNYRPYFLEEAWRLNERLRKNKDWLEIKGAISENCDFKK